MSSRTGKSAEVFLSHASKDEACASRIAKSLGEMGIKVWYSPISLRGADAWHDEIGRALNRSSWFVVLLSPDSVNSAWVKRELVFALSERRYEGRILPVKIKSCKPDKLSWVLRTIQQIDGTRALPTITAEIAGIIRQAGPL